MAHRDQLEFVRVIAEGLTSEWAGKQVLEIGSAIIFGGSVRPFFAGSSYLGIDLSEGPGVDVVSDGSTLGRPDNYFDLSLSCECFEHNPRWVETFVNMHRMIRAGGIVIVTCATTGRFEHGTKRTSPQMSPGSNSIGWNYYRNLTPKDFRKRLKLDSMFSEHWFLHNPYALDLYFVGVKAGANNLFGVDVLGLREKCKAHVEHLHSGDIPSVTRFPRARKLLLAAPDRVYQDVMYYYSKLLARLGIKSG